MEILVGAAIFFFALYMESIIESQLGLYDIGYFAGTILMGVVILWYLRHKIKRHDDD